MKIKYTGSRYIGELNQIKGNSTFEPTNFTHTLSFDNSLDSENSNIINLRWIYSVYYGGKILYKLYVSSMYSVRIGSTSDVRLKEEIVYAYKMLLRTLLEKKQLLPKFNKLPDSSQIIIHIEDIQSLKDTILKAKAIKDL